MLSAGPSGPQPLQLDPDIPQNRVAIGQFGGRAADFGCVRIANLQREARSVGTLIEVNWLEPMDFTFLHAADLHLGSPMLGLSSNDPELAKRVAAASREAFDDLVSEAINRMVGFMLISGDVYDGDWRDTTIAHFFNRQMGRLHRAGIPVFLVKGNHDAESVITGSITLPDSVHSFPSRKPATFRLADLKVAIHGQSFADRAVTQNLALNYPSAEPGWFNVGVLHTSCDGRAGHANYAPCELVHLVQRGYQYWALGHVHTYEVLHANPPIIFPGNLQGRHAGECGPKGAVVVEVRDGEVQNHDRLLLDRIRWALIEVDLNGVSTNAEAFSRIERAIQKEVNAAGNVPVVFRMILRGRTSLNLWLRAETHRLIDEVLAAAAHVTDLIWLEELKVATADPANDASEAVAALANLDFPVLLNSLSHSPELLREAGEAMEIIRAKFPAMPIPDDLFSAEAVEQTIEDACALVISIGTGREGSQA